MPLNPRLLRSLAPSDFSPRQIAGLAMWLDANDEDTLTIIDGKASEWRDKSGNDRDAVQANASYRPTLLSNFLDGKPVLASTLNRHMTVAAWPYTAGNTIIAVFKTASTNKGVAQRGGVNSGPRLAVQNSDGPKLRNTIHGSAAAQVHAQIPYTDDSWSIAIGVTTPSEVQIYNNGSIGESASYSTQLSGDYDLTLFALNTSNLYSLDGEIAEVLYYDRSLTTTERQRVEGYLAWKWGLETQLPYDHPYAASFPGYGSQTVPTDTDALTYLAAVASADGTGVEVSVANAINDFVVGCKSDGIWDAIKASCILAGARTLNGALVSLKPPGPELWSVSTPSITDSGGSSGSWDAGTLEMSNTATGTNSGYPRFLFSLPLTIGRQYTVSGRLDGDRTAISLIRLATSGFANSLSYNSTTGVFSGTVAAGAAAIEFGLDATLGAKSVTIGAISIKESFAPTNNNFVSGDYDRETGLVGNESTKYLDSNRNSNADPQDDHHAAAWISENGGASGSATQKTVIGAGGLSAGAVMVNGRTLDNLAILRMRSAAFITSGSGTAAPGLVGISRSSSANYQYLTTQTALALTQSTASDGIINGNTYVFANNNSGATAHTGHRLAFYSIGESLDLDALYNRVSALITAIGAAI